MKLLFNKTMNKGIFIMMIMMFALICQAQEKSKQNVQKKPFENKASKTKNIPAQDWRSFVTSAKEFLGCNEDKL